MQISVIKYIVLLVILLLLVCNFSNASNNNGIVFLSDIQEPIWFETIYLKYYRNTEASDSLISDIARLKPMSVFLLGDIVSYGTSQKQWNKVNKHLDKIRKRQVEIFAIPGNHEYYLTKKKGLKKFLESFPNSNVYGYSQVVDSVAVVLINSSELDNKEQMKMYRSVMSDYDKSNAIKYIIVATHHSPFTNSSIVSSDKTAQDSLIPIFIETQKAKLFLSGHSHNLEHFRHQGKDFVVLGGGGGLRQPLKKHSKREWKDLIKDADKPFYFYIRVIRSGNTLSVYSRGLDDDFNFFELKILEIE